jgi:Tfp pilus assembly protein PilE
MSFRAETVVMFSIFFIIPPVIFCAALRFILKRKGIKIKLWWKVAGTIIFALFLLIALPAYLNIGKRIPHPKAEAWKNLEVLRLLEEQYYAQKGRYAPEPDGTLFYKEGDTSIQSVFPYFKPGMPKGLNFEYELTASENGAIFIASATGKTGSKVAGERYSINQANERN